MFMGYFILVISTNTCGEKKKNVVKKFEPKIKTKDWKITV